jgi:hypothetical protein
MYFTKKIFFFFYLKRVRKKNYFKSIYSEIEEIRINFKRENEKIKNKNNFFFFFIFF